MDSVQSLIIAVLAIWLVALHRFILKKNSFPARFRVSLDHKILEGLHILKLDSPMRKQVGLLNHLELPKGQGLYFQGSRSIHAQGMHTDFVAIFLGAAGEVLNEPQLINANQATIHSPNRTRHIMELSPLDWDLVSAWKVGAKIQLVAADQKGQNA